MTCKKMFHSKSQISSILHSTISTQVIEDILFPFIFGYTFLNKLLEKHILLLHEDT